MDELERLEVERIDVATDPRSAVLAAATAPLTGRPATVEHARVDKRNRPALPWVVVAVALATVSTALVAWRASASRENRQIDGLLLGPPSNVLGYDTGRPSNAIWLNVAGPRSYTVDGDRFTAGCAGDPPGPAVRSALPASDDPAACPPNPDLDPRGHLFVVRVTKPESQRPLLIEAANPQLQSSRGNEFDRCRVSGPTGVSRQPACPGDLSASGVGFSTTFIVRAPDTTPDDPTDNPAICAATFSDQATDEHGTPTDDLWVRLCAIPASMVLQGDYIVQVRSNADPSAPRLSRAADLAPATGAGSLDRVDPNGRGDGQNHFALRAQWDGGPDENRGFGLTVNALNHLVVFVNQANARVSFPLLNLTASAAGRLLRVRLFDLGDLVTGSPRSAVNDGVDVRVAPPSEAHVDGDRLQEFANCRFTFESGAGRPTPRDRCALDNANRADFNGRQVVVDIPIPDHYSCEAALADCWVNVQINYRGTPNDNSGWTAELVDAGTPVPDPRSSR